MSPWILIVVLSVYGGDMIAMQQFSTQATCEAAKQQVLTMNTEYRARAACVPQ